MLRICIKLLSLFTGILLNYQSYGQDQDIKTVLGYVSKIELIGKSLDEYCLNEGIKTLPEASNVLIIGLKKCDTNFSQSKEFYEVAWRGEKYFINKDAVELSPKDQEKILGYTEADWKEAEIEGINASAYIRSKELSELIDVLNKTAPKGLTILDWSVEDESEYTNGTGVRILVHNPTKKDIKYHAYELFSVFHN